MERMKGRRERMGKRGGQCKRKREIVDKTGRKSREEVG